MSDWSPTDADAEQALVHNARLTHALLILTSRCNLSCSFCAFSHGASQQSSDASVDRWLGVVDELVAAGAQKLVLSGGEPLLHEGFIRILSGAAEIAQHVIVCTNGTLLQSIAAEGRPLPDVRWAVSLHSADPAIHDGRVGQNGSFAETTLGIAALRDRTPQARITINATCNDPGQDYQDLLRLAARLGAEGVTINPQWHPTRGNARHRSEKNRNLPADATGLGLHVLDLRAAPELEAPGCIEASTGLVIDRDGGCHPCSPAGGGFRLDPARAFGNAFESGLSSVLASRALQEFRCRAWHFGHDACEACHAPIERSNLFELREAIWERTGGSSDLPQTPL